MLKCAWRKLACVATKAKSRFSQGETKRVRRMGVLNGMLKLKRCDRRLELNDEEQLRSVEAPHLPLPASPTNRRWCSGDCDCASSFSGPDDPSQASAGSGTCQRSARFLTTPAMPIVKTATSWGVEVSIHLLGGDCLLTAPWVVVEANSTQANASSSTNARDTSTGSTSKCPSRTASLLTAEQGDVMLRNVSCIPLSQNAYAETTPMSSLAKISKQEQQKKQQQQQQQQLQARSRPAGMIVVSVGHRRGRRSKKTKKPKQNKRTLESEKKAAKGERCGPLAATSGLWSVHMESGSQAFHLRHYSGQWLALDDEGRCVLQQDMPHSVDAFTMVFPQSRPRSISLA